MAIARQLGGFSPAQADDLRKAIGKKDQKLMGTPQEAAHGGPRRARRARRRGAQAVGQLRGHRRLLVQQEPRRLLRADQLPDRLAQGQLPGRVHGGRGLERHEHQGQGAVLRQPVPRDGHRGAAARRQREPRRLHRGRRQDPLRHERGQGRGRRRDRVDHRRARPRRPVHLDLSTSAPASTRSWSTSARWRRSSRAAPSTAPATRAAACSRSLPAAMAAGERHRKDRAQGQGGLFDHLESDDEPHAHQPPIGGEEFDNDVKLRFEKEALGLYVSAHPLKGLRAPAARLDRRRRRRPGRPARGHRRVDRRHRLGPATAPHAQRRAHGRVPPGGRGRRHRGRRLRLESSSSTRSCWSKTRSSTCAAASTARARTT